MKLVDNIISRFGTDKVLHFLGGGWITSLFSPLGWFGILIGFAIMLVLSFIKEEFLDNSFDWKDICAASIGGGISVVIYLMVVLISKRYNFHYLLHL